MEAQELSFPPHMLSEKKKKKRQRVKLLDTVQKKTEKGDVSA